MNYYVFPGLKRVVRMSNREIMAEEIVICVNKYFKIDCRKRTRRSEYVEARLIAFRLMRDYTALSLMRIGSEFGVDHTTVMAGLRRLSDMIDTGDPLADEYRGCEEFFRVGF